MLDEWDNAEGSEISQIRDFMVDFRLNDEGDLDLAEFGESCRDTILEKAYPRLLEAITTAPLTPSGGTPPKAKRWSAKQWRRNERARSSRPVFLSPQPRRPEHCRRRWVPRPRTQIEPLTRWRPMFSTRLLTRDVSSSCNRQRRTSRPLGIVSGNGTSQAICIVALLRLQAHDPIGRLSKRIDDDCRVL